MFLKGRQMLFHLRSFAPVNRAKKASKLEERNKQEAGEVVAVEKGQRGKRGELKNMKPSRLLKAILRGQRS